MIFVQTGVISKFLFQALLVQLVAALGMLSVATLIVPLDCCCSLPSQTELASFSAVESMMLYIMPHRREYEKAKVRATHSASYVRSLVALCSCCLCATSPLALTI